jgi:hypothetical protein
VYRGSVTTVKVVRTTGLFLWGSSHAVSAAETASAGVTACNLTLYLPIKQAPEMSASPGPLSCRYSTI